MKNILVTGGCGYIGSHTCVELLKNNYRVFIIDNLSNSNKEVVGKIESITNKKIKLYIFDLLNIKKLNDVFENNKFEAVIHFAGYKAVSESIGKPILYYKNNIGSTINLLEIMKKHGCYNLIFSSSATVYGQSRSPLTETSDVGIGITNPYGQTKYMIEQILKDVCRSDKRFNITVLRYFNPIGCHGVIGENPNDTPNNLMPFILKVATQNNTDCFIDDKYNFLSIFGNDYQTVDGTCIRDYIHVVDLAKGHIKSLQYINNYHVYNLGTGKGTSVLEMINLFKKVNNVKLPYKIVGRREGDIDVVYCNPEKAYRELGWKTELTNEDMCVSAWKFQKINR